MAFGAILRTLRTTAGLSLRELARDLEVSPTYLSLIETGKSPPPIEEKVQRIEDRLGVPRGALLSFTERQPRRVIELLLENPGAALFFQTALDQKLLTEDFDLLSRLLVRGGRQTVARALDRAWEELGVDESSQQNNGSALLGKKFIYLTATSTNWIFLVDEVTRQIAEKFPEIDRKKTSIALLDREKAGSTALGAGLAIPHAILDRLDERIVAMVRIPAGINLSAPDGELVTIAFFILGSETARAYHVYLLARIARFFMHPGLHDRLLKAENETDVLRILNEMDDKIP